VTKTRNTTGRDLRHHLPVKSQSLSRWQISPFFKQNQAHCMQPNASVSTAANREHSVTSSSIGLSRLQSCLNTVKFALKCCAASGRQGHWPGPTGNCQGPLRRHDRRRLSEDAAILNGRARRQGPQGRQRRAAAEEDSEQGREARPRA
jgi:hypothetical protein